MKTRIYRTFLGIAISTLFTFPTKSYALYEGFAHAMVMANSYADKLKHGQSVESCNEKIDAFFDHYQKSADADVIYAFEQVSDFQNLSMTPKEVGSEFHISISKIDSNWILSLAKRGSTQVNKKVVLTMPRSKSIDCRYYQARYTNIGRLELLWKQERFYHTNHMPTTYGSVQSNETLDINFKKVVWGFNNESLFDEVLGGMDFQTLKVRESDFKPVSMVLSMGDNGKPYMKIMLAAPVVFNSKLGNTERLRTLGIVRAELSNFK